jgi:competence protein ComEC
MALAWLGAAFILGVVLGGWAPLPGIAVVLVATGLAAGAIVFRRRRGSFWLLALAALFLGLARSPAPEGAASPGDLRYYNGRVVTLHGAVTAEPDVRDTGIMYVVAVDKLSVNGRLRPVSGRLELRTLRSQQFDYQDALSLQGRLHEPRNLSGLPYRDILARRGIHSQMSFARVVDLGPSGSGWLGWLVPLRQHLERNIDSWLPEPEAALLIAITLGARSASLGDLAPVLVATGLIHIIAISGIKVALIAGMLYQIVRLARRRVLALLVPLAGLLGYVLLTGATASGERSALMWTMLFIAVYLGRATVALVSLGFVAALMVAVDPSLPWDIGFQLTTVGTLSIVALASPLMRFLGSIPLFEYLPPPLRKALSVTIVLQIALSVTLAAQIGTLPIVILGFHVVSLTGPVANALVLPMLPLLILLGFLVGFLGSLSVVVSPLAAFAYALLNTVIWISSKLASLPLALPASALSPVLVGAYYVALAVVAGLVLRRSNWAPVGRVPGSMREFLLALVLGASAVTVSLTYAQDSPQARLYWLGSGQAMLVRSQGMTVLIDGSSRPFVLLERLEHVLPFTTRTIDLVVVTDPRSRNVIGLQEVLAHYGVSEVLDVGAQYPSGTYASWRAQLRNRHIPTYRLTTGVSAHIGAVQLASIGPDALYPLPQDCIGMLRLSTAGRSVLLAGAASPREQQEALFRPVELRADTLLIGDAGSIFPGFLHAVRPHALVTTKTAYTSDRTRVLADGELFSMDL